MATTSVARNKRRTGAEATGDEGAASPPVIEARRRTDLISKKQEYLGQSCYFVKDPLTLRYYKFAPAEFDLFQQLDGTQTAPDLVKMCSRHFGNQGVTENDIVRLIQRWQVAGLLQDNGSAATTRVLAADVRTKRAKSLRWMTGILYMKVRAFDPDALLNRIHPWVRGFFHPIGVTLAVFSMCAAIFLVISRFEQFTSQPELQDFRAYLTLQNMFWLWLSVGIVKVLHEFGHGLACKHFGGECHAMGLLFMCFTPCMYCDVSDSWMLPNKWHRIAIAAAGIYVELLIASLATFVWWSTSPGILHSVAFSAMLYGSVQTVLINANPLLRFDGYYVMSDYLEIPNLRQKSYAFSRYYLKKWFWGSDSPPPGSGGLAFMAYAVTASLWRFTLTFSMIWLFTRLLEPYKLAAVGYVLSGLAVTNMFLFPLAVVAVTAIRNPSQFRPASWWRPLIAIGLIAILLGGFFWLPIPRKAYAVFTLEPAQSSLVSIATRGRLVKQFVSPGDRVRKGDILFELDNPELRMRTANLEEQRDSYLVKSRVAMAILDPATAQGAQVSLKELEKQVALYHQRLEGLQVRSPSDGRIIPEPDRIVPTKGSSGDSTPLGRWNRSLFHPENIGATIEAGTKVCEVAATDDCAAVAVLTQSDVEIIRRGQAATVKLEAFPEETILGEVEEISIKDVETAPPQLLNLNGSELPAITFGPSTGQLASAHYQVRIRLTGRSRGDLEGWHASLKPGLRGRTWISVGTQTASAATWRWICQVFEW